MKEFESLIPGHILSLDSFRRDLEVLLRLSKDQLLQLASIADSPNGFATDVQTVKFAEQASLSFDEARRSLSIAGFLYGRCRDHHISSDDVITELSKIASILRIDISGKESALRSLLAVKVSYEAGRYAERRGIDVGYHFMNIDGTWDIRPVFSRDTGEIVKRVLLLLLNLSWHDTMGTNHDAVFQLNEEDWTKFNKQIEKLQQQYEIIKKHVKE